MYLIVASSCLPEIVTSKMHTNDKTFRINGVFQVPWEFVN